MNRKENIKRIKSYKNLIKKKKKIFPKEKIFFILY
jgi:hypothetical protein